VASQAVEPGPPRVPRWGWAWPVGAHLVLVLAAIAITLVLLGFFNLGAWHEALSGWDTRWYLLIARHGYPVSDGSEWAYFPLFPALMMALVHLGLGALTAGLLISLLATAVLAYLLQRLAAIEVGAADSAWVPWLLLLSPFGFFFFAAYTEALFYSLVAATLLSARRGHFLLAGLLGALASATRVTGVFLLLAVLVEALQQSNWHWRRIPRAALGALVIPLGAIGFAAFAQLRTGSFLAYTRAEGIHFGVRLAWPWVGLTGTAPAALSNNPVLRSAFVPEVAAGVLGIPILVIAARRLRPMYSVFMTLSWLAAVSLAFWRSVPRYEFALFPILFVLVAVTQRRHWIRWVLLVAGGLSMAYGASLFARGLWLD